MRLAIRARLASEDVALETAANPKRASYLERTGSMVDVDGVRARRALVRMLMSLFDHLAQQGGLADLIDLLVGEAVSSGRSPAAVLGQPWAGLQGPLESTIL